MPDPLPPSQRDTSLQQTTTGDRNQVIGQVLGGIVVYVSGGQAVFHSASTESDSSATKSATSDIGPNPYKGLMAFQETDGDRFFGREKQIAALWKKLRSLHETESAIRVLPIYGPSGSGKSSLARAGLIPELARHPIPGYDRARVAILVPGTHPLESLATVLARIVTQDLTPVAKTREFAGELQQVNGTGEYDGLRRIADVMPDIAIAPLIVLVDQFEEVYTLCEGKAERDSFIGNLLHAAGDRAKRVTVIVTLRSDFLGETQKHAVLNRLFSEQGYLVSAMAPEELRQAIAKPAELAGYPLDAATIDLLVKDTEGREGALPLLQFALTRIWEGLAEGKQPAETLKLIGGVGGALAGEAQRIYEKLSNAEQNIAHRIFLKLVQLGDVVKYTRRRTAIANLASSSETTDQVKRVIGRFAVPSIRLITLSKQADGETAEITHEALFDHWQLLQDWLENNRLFLVWQEHLRSAIRQWELCDRDPEALLRGKPLTEAEDWFQKQETDLSQIEQTYIQASLVEQTRLEAAENERQQREYDLLKKFVRTAKVRTRLALSATGLAIVALLAGGFAWYQQQQAEQAQRAFLLGIEPAKPELLKKLPEFLKEADRLRSTRKEENIQLALAYYRKILSDTFMLRQAIQSNPAQFQKQDDQTIKAVADNSKDRLIETIRQTRIPQLKKELENGDFGNINEQIASTNIEKRFTGSLQTTVKILMSSFGAKADLNSNGQIDNKEESEQMPCEILEDIENLWRKSTKEKCGWYGSTDKYLEPACSELNGRTLMTSVFVQPYSEIIKQLNTCPGRRKP
ncbi:MAG TPA: ATP-binding protein [Leptolyngbyaceae cyanobacterium M33_DOE_097]|nr:ATP-binding protein [Leptolyngbyaceae cyanobacterium M33_DOE_097]